MPPAFSYNIAVKNTNQRNRIWLEILVVLLLLAVFIAPRASDLDRFLTIDEGLWMYHSSQFYYAIGQREFENTFQRFHPGVTMMWSGMLGFIAEYPEFRGIGQGYLDSGIKLGEFLLEQGESPLDILAAGRAFVVAQNALVFLIAYWAARKLLPFSITAAAFAILSLEPFFVSLTQILQMDGLMASYMFASILALLAFLYGGDEGRPVWRRGAWLWVSGALAGAAVLTKAPAVFLLPYTGLMLTIRLIEQRDFSFRAILRQIVAPGLVWLAVAAAVFAALWPAMWVDPAGMIGKILSISSDRLAEGINFRLFFNGQTLYGDEFGWYFYPLSFAWRSSPVILLGLAAAAAAYFKRWGVMAETKIRQMVIGLVMAGFFFSLEMGLGALKMDRYIIPVHLALGLVSVLGWLSAAQQVASRRQRSEKLAGYKNRILAGVVVLLLMAQVWQLAGTYPYNYAYYNPLFGGTKAAEEMFWLGWGEGLEEVGAYLSPMHDANKLKVMSLHALGPLSYYFQGKVYNKPWPGSITFEEIEKLDYIVIYVSERQTNHHPAVQEVLGKLEPEYTVTINQVDYARLYNMDDIPPAGWNYLRQELPTK